MDESAINRDSHYCAKCGANLIVCYEFESPNVGHAQFCRVCGQLMLLSPAPNEIAGLFARETRDFDVLDQDVPAILKLRGGLISLSETGAALGVSTEEITGSIERLELAHQIERAESGP
jgi:hypothetical protein